jgi:hypothetical protein
MASLFDLEDERTPALSCRGARVNCSSRDERRFRRRRAIEDQFDGITGVTV